MGHNDLGDFCYAHGLLGDTFKHYIQSRNYGTTAKKDVDICLNAILVSIETGQVSDITNYMMKAEQATEVLDPVTVAKLPCAAGLAHLKAKKYKPAARKICHFLTHVSLALQLGSLFFNMLTTMLERYICTPVAFSKFIF